MKYPAGNGIAKLIFTRRFAWVLYLILYLLFLVLVIFHHPSGLYSNPLKLVVYLLGVPALGAGSTFLSLICPGLLIFYGQQNREPYKIWTGLFLYIVLGLIIWVGREQ